MIAYRPLHPDDLLLGTTLAGWHLVERIASSDHAAVFRAECDGVVGALKVSRGGSDHEAARRIEREAVALRRVAHPAVAALLAAGAARGTPYVVTAWVPGTSLATRLGGGALPWTEVRALLVAIADGLLAIHRAGIVHRDIKPSNIIVPAVTPCASAQATCAIAQPAAVLLDLGHASVLGDPRITPSDVTVGSAGYMAPEQLAGAAPDARWDVYALGVIAYRALTGVTPFATTESWRVQQRTALVPPRKRAPELAIPREADDLCLWMLAREPRERLPSAQVLALTLRAVSTGKDV